MQRHSRWVLCALLLIAGISEAQTAKKADDKKDGSTNEVEVRFGDGSTVRMLLLQESIEIVTKYGKLNVPTKDIRGIDLGLHLPKGMDERIDGLIKKLNSSSFKERDQAVNELVELGPMAFPTLVKLKAAKLSELEVTQRVEIALKRIRAKIPADLLRTATTDKVLTTDFPIVGQIVSPAIKAKSPYFGERELQLTELRSINWTTGKLDTEFVIEGAKYAMNNQWMDTGLMVEVGMTINITASGEIDLLNDGTGDFFSGPNGNRNSGRRGNRLPGELMAKIGESGTAFRVGERFSGPATQEGKLYFNVIPLPFNNNQLPGGSYKATVKLSQAGF